MGDFRCPRYWWDGNHWRCQNLPKDYLNSYDFDTYCTNRSRCLECPYMDSEVREKVAEYKKEAAERVKEQAEEQMNRESDDSFRDKGASSGDNGSFETSGGASSSDSSSCDSGGSGLGIIVDLIMLVVVAILKMCYFISLPYMILYAGPTFYLFLVTLISILAIPPFGIVCLVVSAVMTVMSIPYWKRLFKLKKRASLSKNEFGRLWAMWGLKFRLAYSDLEAAEKKYQNYL